MQKTKNSFKNLSLFDQAMTHRSWVNENKNIRPSNERMEFLGDAILEYVVSRALYERFPDQEEGFLTALRANLVNTENLAQLAAKLQLGEALFLSKGEEEGGGRSNPSLLADTVEALIGALFLDGGLARAEKFIETWVLAEVETKLKSPLKDAKSRLQEDIQARGEGAPRYRVVSESGPDHAKEFRVQVRVGEEVLGEGAGSSKNTAQQAAAKAALEKMGKAG